MEWESTRPLDLSPGEEVVFSGGVRGRFLACAYGPAATSVVNDDVVSRIARGEPVELPDADVTRLRVHTHLHPPAVGRMIAHDQDGNVLEAGPDGTITIPHAGTWTFGVLGRGSA